MENVKQMTAQVADTCEISSNDIENVFCVTPMQEGLWAASTQKRGAYDYELLIQGKVNVLDSFKAAWQELVRMTPMLRSFMLVLGPANQLCQVVLSARSSHAGRMGSPALQLSRLESKGLARLSFLFDESKEKNVFKAILRIHHALFDGWAMRLVLNRLRDAYHGKELTILPDLELFINFVHNQNAAVERNGSTQFWQSRLADHDRTEFVERISGRSPMTNSSETYTDQRVIEGNVTTLTISAILHAAWALLVSSYSDTDDVLFATALSGRDVPVEGVLDMAGPTMAAVPCRVHVRSEQTVAKFVEQVASDLHIVAANQHVGLAKICREYGGFQNSELQTLLVCQPSYLDVVGFQSDNDTFDPDWRVTEHADFIHPYALVIECWLPRGVGTVRFTAHYDSELLSSAQVRLLLQQFSDVIFSLNACLGDTLKSQALVGDVSIISSADLHALQQLNADYPSPVDRCIHDLFGESVHNHSDAIGIDAWDAKFTYKRIDELSDALAERLVRLGVGHEKPVLVFSPKSSWVVISILAVLKAGGAFVPLEPAQPDGRIQEIVHIIGSTIAISDPSLTSRLSNVLGPNAQILEISKVDPEARAAEFRKPLLSTPAASSPSSLAYIMFTSGTAGVPKGVAMAHRALSSSIMARIGPEAMNMKSSSRVLQFSSFCFDAFIDEVFMTLVAGACICIPHEDELQSNFPVVFERYHISWTFLTPSVARILDPKRMRSIQTLTLGGEAVLLSDIQQWKDHVPQLRNGYGPTECCVICVVGDCLSENLQLTSSSFLGTSRGCLAWVVDPSAPSRLKPFGAAGELLIEGPNLACGYWADSAGTAASWISDPDWPNDLGRGRRLYRTGDLVRMRPDGSLHYLRRIDGDSQVKLRGQRFDLAEVEQNVRKALPSVQQVLAAIFTPFGFGPESKTSASEDTRLALCFAGHAQYTSPIQPNQAKDVKMVSDQQVLPEPLREELLAARRVLDASLPSYMVPSYWVPMQNISLTASGKADRKRMAQVLQNMPHEQLACFWLDKVSTRVKSASTVEEKQLLKLWSAILGIDESSIDVDSDFIFLGGDSIKAMRLAALSQSHGMSGISTQSILQCRTIQALAKTLKVSQDEQSEDPTTEVLPSPLSLLTDIATSPTAAVLEAAKACQVAPSVIQDLVPATAIQRGLFTFGLNNNHAYRGLFVFELRSDVDLARLQDAWCALVSATPIIRSRLCKTPDGLFQAVLQDSIPCQVVLSSLDEHLAKQREASRAMSFGTPLYHVSIVQDNLQGQHRTYLVLSSHHAVYDGWSISEMIRQLTELYCRQKRMDDPYNFRNPYVRYVNYVLHGSMDSHQVFWKDYLSGSPFAAFPDVKRCASHWEPRTDASTNHVFPFRGSQFRTSIVIYSAWSQLTAIYAGTDDIVFGIVTTGRDISILSYSCDIVGPMVATIPLRVRVPAEQEAPVSTLFNEVQNSMGSLTPHEHYGISEIRKTSPDAEAACGFHSLLVVQAASQATGQRESDDDLIISVRDVGANIHPYPLVLEATTREDRYIVDVVAHYDSSLFDEATVKRLLDQLGHISQELVRLGETGGTLGQLDPLSPTDRARVLGWNSDPAAVLPIQRCVHDVISDHAVLHPGSTAVCAWDEDLTYAELDSLSSSLAAKLRVLGVRTGQFVPICHEKSAWFVVAQVAVLKAGAACVSLDPTYPKSRNEEIVAQCPAFVIIVSNTTKPLFSASSVTLVVAAELQPRLPITPPSSPDISAKSTTPSDVAYCVFTSGSTGKPKGIIIEHAALCTSARHYGAALRLGPASRVLQFASCAFDVSVGETLTTLMHGGSICIPQEDERLADLAGCVNRLQVNWLYLTSSVASVLRPADVPGLETLVIGGELVHQQVIETWAGSGVVLINAYGPAETTIYCSALAVQSRHTDARDIGLALGCRMWIGWALDQDNSNLRLAPVGATGEILIEGPILAREYLGRSDLNSTSFMGVPWLPPDRRVYRTGDLAFQDSEGHFHFRGRRDDGQVKINGQRVDLGEVTTTLASTRPDIREAAALTYQRKAAADEGSHSVIRLSAFIVFADMASDGLVDTPSFLPMTDRLQERMLDIRKHLQRLLPKHMLPSVFLPMTSLPKSRTLKVDRRALKAMVECLTDADLDRSTLAHESSRLADAKYKAPRNSLETTLLQHWTKALGLSEKAAHVGVDDNFFDLGGDSINAMHFIWLARGDGLHLSVADVHSHSSVSELAKLLGREEAMTSTRYEAWDVPVPFSLVSSDEKCAVMNELHDLDIYPDDVEDIYHATATQVGLLLETEKHKNMWVSKDTLKLTATVDAKRLRAAWEGLVEQNAIFRTRVVYAAAAGADAQAYQIILRYGDAFAVWDDGSEDPVFGFGRPLSVHRLRDNHLEWIRHHSLYDGWATNLLLHQLEHLYRTGSPTTQMVLPPSSYVHWLQCQNADTAKSFWRTELGDVGVDACHACAFPRTLSHSHFADHTSTSTVPSSAAGSSTTRPAISLPVVKSFQGATIARLPILVEAAWALTLSAYVSSQDVIFGVVRSGRSTHPSLAHVVCPTASIVPRRYKANDEKSVCAFLEDAIHKAETATPHEHIGLGVLQDALHRHKTVTLNNLVVVQTEELVSGTSETGGQSYLEAIGLKPATDNGGETESDAAASPFPFGLVLECIVLRSQGSDRTKLQLLTYYDEHQIREDRLQRVLSHFEHILIQLIETPPDTLLGEIGIWSQQLLRDQMPFIHSAPPPHPVELCVQELISQHWKQGSPNVDSPAVYTGQQDHSFTYKDLDTLSARLCHSILGDERMDKQRSPFMAICFERSSLTVVALLAIWRAGYATILLDITQPHNVNLKILREANVSLVLVTPKTREIMRDQPGVVVIHLSELRKPVAGQEKLFVSPSNSKSEDPCYCIFTSGSTGEPKGVVVQHRAIATSAVHHGRLTDLSTSSRVLQFSSYSFDVAIDEIVTTLVHGGCVCVPSEMDTKARLADAITELDVNVALLTPGVLETLDPAAVTSLKTVVVGGSSLRVSLRNIWQSRVRLLVAYGPSECSVTASMDTDIDTKPATTIGKPVGCRAWVLGYTINSDGDWEMNRRPRLAPFGSVGELAIEGPILAQGYLKEDKASFKKFIPASGIAGGFCASTGCSPETRLYRTGDMVTQTSDGSLLFLGRSDNQVKVRGMRVNLEAVEHAILHCPLFSDPIGQIIIVLPQKGHLQDRLVGVLEIPEEPNRTTFNHADGIALGDFQQMERLKGYLSEHLPASHIPEIWLSVTSMPKLASFKVDRARIRHEIEASSWDRHLRNWNASNSGSSIVGSKTPAEKLLRDLMGQILKADLSLAPSSATFPQLGGNSLMAMQLVARCKAVGVPISLSHVLGNHTIVELAQGIDKSKGLREQHQPPNGLQTSGRIPLTPAQRMFFSVYPWGPNYFNQSTFFRVRSVNTSAEQLKSHLLKLVGRHPALRSRFMRRKDTPDCDWHWECSITDDIASSLGFHSHLLGEGKEVESVARVTAETQQVLNISAGPLFIATVFTLPCGTLDVLLVVHHLVVDIVSWTIILNDLEMLLSGGSLCSSTPSFHSLSVYSDEEADEVKSNDYAVLEETYEFWGMENPTKLSGRRNPSHASKRWTVSLTANQTRILTAAVRNIDSLDVADVVEAALCSTFADTCRHLGRKTVPCIFVEEHGRGNEHAEMVGWLTRIRHASLSPSPMALTEGIWQARHSRLNPQSRKDAFRTRSSPFEIVLNYAGLPLLDETEYRLLEHVPSNSAHREAVETVPDTDPWLDPLALIEVVASFCDQGLSLTVTCDNRLQNVDRVHTCINSSLRKLHVDAPSMLASLEIRQSLRPLSGLDNIHYNISQRRRAQVVQMLALKTIDEVQDVLVCTPTQARIVSSQARDSHHYRINATWEVSNLDAKGGVIDAVKLQEACDKVVRHHPSLRVTFLHLPDLAAPVQIVLQNSPAKQVLRVLTVTNGQHETIHINLDISHAAFDGVSTATILRDIRLAYYGEPLDTSNINTLRRFAAYVEQSTTKAADEFWAQYLADVQPRCLPQMGVAAQNGEMVYGGLDYKLDERLQRSMSSWCRGFKATPAVAIHVAWALTLRAYTGYDDVNFGWMTTGRDAPVPGIEDAIGMFSSLVVCRATMAPEDSLTNVVATVVRELASSLEHQLGSPKLHQQGHPLFDTLVSVQTPSPEPLNGGDLVFDQLDGIDRTEFTLVLNVGVAHDVVEIRLTYNSLKILGSVAQDLLSAFEKALGSVLGMSSDASVTVASINLCSQLHCRSAQDFNNQAALPPEYVLEAQTEHTITDLFSRQVLKRAEILAIESWDACFTFAELDRLSAALAHRLSRAGVTHGRIVPLLCDKSATVVVGLLGILRVGASCAFLSPNDGVQRLREIIVNQIEAVAMLASPDHVEKARTLGCSSVIVLDSKSMVKQGNGLKDHINCTVDVNRPEDVAFVVFTSGSTGQPKGVMIPHSALCFSALNYGHRLGVSERSRIFQFSAYTFDVAIGDMVAALIHGSTLCVPSEHDRINDLSGAIERFKPSWLMITPSVATMLDPLRCSSLRSLSFIGEVPTRKLYSTWHGLLALYNAWGPAEGAVLSSIHQIQSQSDLLNVIGEPVSCRLWLVHPSDPSRLVPSGCLGEILIEGPNIAYGYLKDDERTKQVFLSGDNVPEALHPLLPKSRLYLTGDLARFLPHNPGMLLFEGRKDSQIKIRGQRIELGEIESHLARLAQETLQNLETCSHRVFCAVDIFNQRKEENALVAFLTVLPADETGAKADSPAAISDLTSLLGFTVDETSFYERLEQQLHQHLSAYMVPSLFLTLSSLPKSPSGKLDRRALRALAQAHWAQQLPTTKSHPDPTIPSRFTDQRQIQLRALWSKVLDVDEKDIGPESNFFRLGGDSIAAMRLAAAVMSTKGLTLSVFNIMKFPELSRMSKQIQLDMLEPEAEQKSLNFQATTVTDDKMLGNCHTSEFPATEFQASMVNFNIGPERGFTNYFILNFSEGTIVKKLESACRILLAHYAVLRSCFVHEGDVLLQQILPNVGSVAIEHHKFTAAEDLDAAAGNIIKSDRAAPLQWGDCLTGIFILQQEDTSASRLIFRLSHALYDGMCLPALWRDLSRAYDGESLGPEDTTFTNFARTATIVSHEAATFWKGLLCNSRITSVACEPSTGASFGSAKGLMQGRASCAIPSTHFALFSLPPASVLRTAWAVVLAGLSSSPDVVFGHVISGREMLAPSMLEAFGAFLNIIPCRVHLPPGATSAKDFVQSVHDQHVSAIPHSNVGLRQLVDLGCVDWPPDVRFSSVVQYQNLLNNSIVTINSGSLAGVEIYVDGSTGAYADLWITATPDGALTNVDVVFDELVVPSGLANKLLTAVCSVLRELHADEAVSTATLLEAATACFAPMLEVD